MSTSSASLILSQLLGRQTKQTKYKANGPVAMFRKLFGKYDALQTSRPVLVKCITAGLLAGTADLIAQAASDDGVESLEAKGSAAKKFNIKRALAFSMFGMSWAGCFNHYW